MSFSFDFYAETGEEAEKILDEITMPGSVRAFVTQALKAYPVTRVKVKASGHLFNGDYKTSTGTIEVMEVQFRKPKQEN